MKRLTAEREASQNLGPLFWRGFWLGAQYGVMRAFAQTRITATR